MKTLALFTIALLTACSAPDARAASCKPYVTHTCVVKARTECRWAVNTCGKRYSCEVKVVTYRSY